MTPEDAKATLYEVSVLWSAGFGDGTDVIRAACATVVAGAGGPALDVLAGVSLRRPDAELSDALPPALAELGLRHFSRNDAAGKLEALRIQCARALAGDLPPRELARWTHSAFGHEPSPLAGDLAALDDVYDDLIEGWDSFQTDERTLDSSVMREARRITGELAQPHP